MLIAMSCIVFLWAWDTLTSYLNEHFFGSSATLDDVVEAVAELREEVANSNDEPHTLEVVA